MKKPIVLGSILFWVLSVCVAGAAEVTMFGPKKFLRTTGAPDLYADSFMGMMGKATIYIKNGEADGTNRISSAVILINGDQILGASDFNQEFFEKAIYLDIKDDNVISLELRSAPGSYLQVEVKQEIFKVAYASYGASGADICTLVLDAELNIVSNSKLTSSPPYQINPTWSRDGKKIAYRYGGHEIWAMNEDGSDKQRVITSSMMVFPSVWAADPDYVYGDNNYAGDGEVAKFNIVAGTIEMLTDVPGYNTQSFDLNASQTEIAFVRGFEGNGWSNKLYKADFVSTGSDFQNIVLLSAAAPAPHDPKYSPSGSRILSLIMQAPYYVGIGIVNTDNTGFWTPVPISTSGIVGSADWIDEYRIIYSFGSYTSKNLFILDLRDNSTRQLTFTDEDKYYISVSK